jgi:hypothetical protein
MGFIRTNIRLFSTAFLKVALVSANTLFINKVFFLGIGVAGFLISSFWTYNVRRILIGSMADRL